MQRILSLSRSSLSSAIISPISPRLMAFFFSGRFNVSHATPVSSSIFGITVFISTMFTSCTQLPFLLHDYQRTVTKIKRYSRDRIGILVKVCKRIQDTGLEPTGLAKTIKKIGVNSSHYSKGHGITPGGTQFRHVVKVHAVNTHDHCR